MTEQEMGLQNALSRSAEYLLSRGAVAEVIAQSVNLRATLELTNGAQSYVADVVHVQDDNRLVMIFENGCPARDQEFWVRTITLAADTAGYTQADDTVVAFLAKATSAKVRSEHLVQVAGIAAE